MCTSEKSWKWSSIYGYLYVFRILDLYLLSGEKKERHVFHRNHEIREVFIGISRV